MDAAELVSYALSAVCVSLGIFLVSVPAILLFITRETKPSVVSQQKKQSRFRFEAHIRNGVYREFDNDTGKYVDDHVITPELLARWKGGSPDT